MDLFFWIVDLLLPVTITLLGLIFYLRPPKKINGIYGYRTRRSMASQEAWDTAHRICGRIWLVAGPVLIAVSAVIQWIFSGAPETVSLALVGISFLVLALTVAFVEKKLKSVAG